MSEEEYKKAFSKNLRAYTEANGKTQADKTIEHIGG